MSAVPDRALLLFLDGVGVGPEDDLTNPLAAARLPNLRGLLGGRFPFLDETGTFQPITAESAGAGAADATLGVPGRPQSATGQTALLTGLNAPLLFRRHFGPWVPTALRSLLLEQNVLTRVRAAGREPAFANAHPGHKPRRPAAFPLAAQGAGVLDRDGAALREGRAVASSISNHAWQRHLDPTMPDVTPEEAGRHLAAITATADLTVFAHYDTDAAGHHRDMAAGVRAIERVDRFIGGLVQAIPPETLVVITSDHGNLETILEGHTVNPVPVIAIGKGWRQMISRVAALTDVAPALLELMEID